MVSGKLFKIVTAGAIVLGLGVTLAYASADDAVKGRQGCMKAHGKTTGELAAMFKGEKPYDAAAIQASLAEMDAGCAGWDKWWGADTQKGETLETWAKPEVWSDPEGFKAASGIEQPFAIHRITQMLRQGGEIERTRCAQQQECN